MKKYLLYLSMLIFTIILTSCSIDEQVGTSKRVQIIEDNRAVIELTRVASENESKLADIAAKVEIAKIQANSNETIAKDGNSTNLAIASINNKNTLDVIFWIVLTLIIISGIVGFFYSRKPQVLLLPNGQPIIVKNDRILPNSQTRENFKQLPRFQVVEEIDDER